MKTKRWCILALVAIVFVCLIGIYFIIFPPGKRSDLLKNKLEQAQEKVEILTQENKLKMDRINDLSREMKALEAKYRVERRGRIEAVEEKYFDIDAHGTVDALNDITSRARERRRMETVPGRGDLD